jgi:hypothetical protein
MLWFLLAVVFIVGVGGVGVMAYLHEKRHPRLPPVYVIMQLDVLDNTREVWTTYDTREEAREAIRALHDLYGDIKVFWLEGDPGPPTLRLSEAEAQKLIQPPSIAFDIWEICTSDSPTRIVERFEGLNARERALEALTTRYGPGHTARPR